MLHFQQKMLNPAKNDNEKKNVTLKSQTQKFMKDLHQ